MPDAEPAQPQDVLTPITEDAVFLTACVDPGGEATIADLLPDLAGLRRSVGFRAPDARLSCVVGIGAALWDRLFDFSTALTGNLYFVPSEDFLDDPPLGGDGDPGAPPTGVDDSLGIGSLRGRE